MLEVISGHRGSTMLDSVHTTTIAHAIQLAVAPVFLLTGIGAILNVLTSRLARIIDRMRLLQGRSSERVEVDSAEIDAELEILTERGHLVHWAIALSTASALMVCGVIAVLFVGSFATFDFAVIVAVLFVIAMFCLITSLLYFMREIQLAISRMPIVH